MNQGQLGKHIIQCFRRHTTYVFLIWCVLGRASTIARFSHPDLEYIFF